jgi:hypothetical protein
VSNRQVCEARERNPGEGPGKAVDDGPWKAKTQGSIQRAGGLTLGRIARDSRKGEIPRAVADRAGPVLRALVSPEGKTAGGLIRVVITRVPFQRRTLRRVNPMSAAGAKQNRRGIEGRKPSRG